MKVKTLFLVMALLLALSPLAFSQSKDTGLIEGTVMDQEKVPLPGATVTISSPNLMGVRTYISDSAGAYRFPALPPGVYQVKAELAGFKTYIQDSVRVQTTMRLSLDLTLVQSVVEEEVTVLAVSPTVDVKSTETASVTLSNDILRNIPYNQFSSDIVNLAPGVNNNVAYGASANTGIAYSMDGVNVADPEAGSAWVFVDHNIIEEAKVMGLGLPAEYGNFTGVIFNLVTKSGGNNFSGHMEADFQGKKSDFPKGLWQTGNFDAYLADFPWMSAPLLKLYDFSAHLGGPIKKDKIWFYTGAQFYRSQNYPTGFPEAVDYKQPRWFGKLSAQLSPSTPMTLSLEIDTYLGINRGAGSNISPEATVEQTSPEIVGNFSLTHIFSPKTFIDFKAAFFMGYYYLEPEMGRDVIGRYDVDNNWWYGNATYYYLADRSRVQANASLTHYAEDFIQGNHDFKFGVEVERSWARSRYGFTGPEQAYYIDYASYYYAGPNGEYLKYQYDGYDTNTSYIRAEIFAQDSWQISSRLNVNLGLRFSNNWGFVKGVSGSVFQTSRIAPRVGLTFDILGDKSTIFKAHYGHFTEAMLTAMLDRLNPTTSFSQWNSLYWDWWSGGGWALDERYSNPAPNYRAVDNLKHPYLEQFTVSIERELFKDASFTVSYINRSWKDFIFRYDRASTWEEVTYYSSALDRDMTVYRRTSNPFDGEMDQWLQNDVPGQNPYRKYQGVELLFNKRFSHKWQLLASYVYSVSKGTINNNFGGDINWQGSMDNPNLWINADGNSTNDPTHMLKLQGTYLAPLGIYVNAYFRAITGNSYATRYRPPYIPGRATIFAEPRGSHHYDVLTSLDVRLEKTFMLAEKYRLGILLDVFNVFNNDTITSWGNQVGASADYYPGTGDYSSTSDHYLYGIQAPRQARVGIRLIF